MNRHPDKISSAIYRVNKYLRVQLQRALKEFDITTDQWLVLGKVCDSSGTYNQKELAELCFKERAAITRMLDIMQKKGIIKRGNSPEDRREYLIYATDYGRALYEKTLQSTSQVEKYISEIIKEQEIDELLQLLMKLEDGLKM